MLREIAGLDEARAVPGIVEVTPSIPPGQMILPLPEGSRYLGFLFARADTPAAVERALREAFRKLEIRIDPAPAGAGGLATAPL
jgi:hypothetical protein